MENTEEVKQESDLKNELSYDQLLGVESPHKYATTEQFLAMAKSAEGTNRCIDIRSFSEDVDLEGFHTISLTFPHNDFEELRTAWLCKMKGTMEPQRIWLDLPIDSTGYAIYEGLPTTADASLAQKESDDS